MARRASADVDRPGVDDGIAAGETVDVDADGEAGRRTVMVPLLVMVLEIAETRRCPKASSPRRMRPLLLIVPDEPL